MAKPRRAFWTKYPVFIQHWEQAPDTRTCIARLSVNDGCRRRGPHTRSTRIVTVTIGLPRQISQEKWDARRAAPKNGGLFSSSPTTYMMRPILLSRLYVVGGHHFTRSSDEPVRTSSRYCKWVTPVEELEWNSACRAQYEEDHHGGAVTQTSLQVTIICHQHVPRKRRVARQVR